MFESIHRSIDRAAGRLIARFPGASIESTVGDLDPFVDRTPRECHPAVEPATLSFDSSGNGIRTTRTRFSFESPVTTSKCNDRVPGQRWTRTCPRESGEAVIMLHGGFAPGFAAERLLAGPLLADSVDVFVIALPYHGSRSPERARYSGQYLFSGDVPRLIEGVIQGVADVRALVGALRERGYDHVALSGISLGGCVAAQTLALEPIERALLAIPGVDLYHSLWETPIGGRIATAARDHGFDDECTARAMAAITPIDMGDPVTNPEDIRALVSRYDELAPPESTRRLAEAWGFDLREYRRGHRTIALSMLRIRSEYEAWLRRQDR